MRIIQCESAALAAARVAEVMVERLESQPTSVLGLATGNTMIPMYREWVRLAQDRNVDHGKAFFFLLDEYLGIPANHPSSFETYIRQHLVAPLGLRRDQYALPPVHDVPLDEVGGSFERSIREAGGIDLQLLGIGANGHIGFNEPGSFGDSRTRRVLLASGTRETNAKSFQGVMPHEAVTMGIGTILEARSIILLATGASKAAAIKYLLNHHDDPSCPVTFLKAHPHFTLVLDSEAASSINLKI